MMEHISLIKRNKKGVSMAELIAYVALYGVVMSLLASLVFLGIGRPSVLHNKFQQRFFHNYLNTERLF